MPPPVVRTRGQLDRRRAFLARQLILSVAILCTICMMFAFAFGERTPVGIGAMALGLCCLFVFCAAITKVYGSTFMAFLHRSAIKLLDNARKPRRKKAAEAPPSGVKTDEPVKDMPRHARASHIADDKKRAALAANTLRAAGTIPEVPSPVGLDPMEICHHARRAVLLRQRDGGLREVDRGHLVLTDRRIFYAGTTVFSTIHYRDIRALKFVTARSFSIMCGGAPDTFDVEYPREFLAYMGLVCHKRGVNLPRVSGM